MVARAVKRRALRPRQGLRARRAMADARGLTVSEGTRLMNDALDEDEITLPSGLVLDLVQECKHLGTVARPLLKMTSHLDPSQPQLRCGLDLFNDASDWIERELGMTSVRLAGRQIGHRLFAAMRALGLPETPPASQMLRELESTSRTVIADRQGRGWDLMRYDPMLAVMRNTQEINCVLGEGLLLCLMEHSKATGIQLRQSACVRHGDEVCEYEIRWTGEHT